MESAERDECHRLGQLLDALDRASQEEALAQVLQMRRGSERDDCLHRLAMEAQRLRREVESCAAFPRAPDIAFRLHYPPNVPILDERDIEEEQRRYLQVFCDVYTQYCRRKPTTDESRTILQTLAHARYVCDTYRIKLGQLLRAEGG